MTSLRIYSVKKQERRPDGRRSLVRTAISSFLSKQAMERYEL